MKPPTYVAYLSVERVSLCKKILYYERIKFGLFVILPLLFVLNFHINKKLSK